MLQWHLWEVFHLLPTFYISLWCLEDWETTLIYAAIKKCNCVNILPRSWHRRWWYICLRWSKVWYISPSGSFCIFWIDYVLKSPILFMRSSPDLHAIIIIWVHIPFYVNVTNSFFYFHFVADCLWFECENGCAGSILPGNSYLYPGL